MEALRRVVCEHWMDSETDWICKGDGVHVLLEDSEGSQSDAIIHSSCDSLTIRDEVSGSIKAFTVKPGLGAKLLPMLKTIGLEHRMSTNPTPIKRLESPTDYRPSVWVKAAKVIKGQIDPVILRRLARAHLNELHACGKLRVDAQKRGRREVKVDYDLDESGEVLVAKVSGEAAGDDKFRSCIEQAWLSWGFPSKKGQGPITINQTLLFEPPK